MKTHRFATIGLAILTSALGVYAQPAKPSALNVLGGVGMAASAQNTLHKALLDLEVQDETGANLHVRQAHDEIVQAIREIDKAGAADKSLVNNAPPVRISPIGESRMNEVAMRLAAAREYLTSDTHEPWRDAVFHHIDSAQKALRDAAVDLKCACFVVRATK